MKEKDIVIDACYILGTSLLFKNSVDRELLNRIEDRLANCYEIDLSDKKITSSVEEWKDFFRFNSEGHIILTKEGICNKALIRFLFAEALEPEIYERLRNAILNIKDKEVTKTKILRFPK